MAVNTQQWDSTGCVHPTMQLR